MKLTINAVKDTVQGEFMSPWYVRNKEEAKRSFAAAINSNTKGAPICDFYADMQLFELGELNTTTGEILPHIEFLASGSEVKSFEKVETLGKLEEKAGE